MADAKAGDVSPEQQTDLMWDYLKGFHAVHLIDIGGNWVSSKLSRARKTVYRQRILPRPWGFIHPMSTSYAERHTLSHLLEGDDGDEPVYRLAPHFDTILVDQKHPRYLAPYFKGATSY